MIDPRAIAKDIADPGVGQKGYFALRRCLANTPQGRRLS